MRCQCSASDAGTEAARDDPVNCAAIFEGFRVATGNMAVLSFLIRDTGYQGFT
jgi:hypothetical protein